VDGLNLECPLFRLFLDCVKPCLQVSLWLCVVMKNLLFDLLFFNFIALSWLTVTDGLACRVMSKSASHVRERVCWCVRKHWLAWVKWQYVKVQGFFSYSYWLVVSLMWHLLYLVHKFSIMLMRYWEWFTHASFMLIVDYFINIFSWSLKLCTLMPEPQFSSVLECTFFIEKRS
jgi:hypothetical protein